MRARRSMLAGAGGARSQVDFCATADLPATPRRCGLAAITTTRLGPAVRKRISRLTAKSLPLWMRLFAKTLIGAS